MYGYIRINDENRICLLGIYIEKMKIDLSIRHLFFSNEYFTQGLRRLEYRGYDSWKCDGEYI